MIDEELYQQATDELNSDRRRPHLWARACALASDDHDEARYLYTNLRVEELIAERDRAAAAGATAPTSPEVSLDQLALEPVASTSDLDADPFGVAPASDDADPPIAAIKAGADGSASLDGGSLDAGLFELLDEHEARPSSVRTERRLDLDDLDELNLDSSDIAADNDRSSTAEPLAGRAREAGAAGAASLTAEDREPLSPGSAPRDLGGRPSADLAAQRSEAFDLDDRPTSLDTSAVDDVEHTLGPTRDDAAPYGSRADDRIDDAIDAAAAPRPDVALAAGAALARAQETRGAEHPGTHEDYASARDVDRLLGEDDLDEPIADLDGPGAVWAVYETGDGRLKAVRRGLSWGAMWLTLPWLVVRGLLGTALVYTLLWAAVAIGLLLTGLAWLDAGAAAGTPLKLACIAFAAIAFLGLVVAPLVRANRWRENRWLRRGYALRGELRARSADDALHRLRALTG